MYGGSGTIGNSGILECEARTNQAICSVKFNNDYIIDYYGFYYILAIRKHWMIYAVGTRKDPNISQDVVKRMPCVIPPLVEQVEIIEYLDKKCVEMDTLIAQKTALLEEMESYKKSVIYEYVTGKKEV
jgi:type I restriction enzyme S subunit